MNCAEVRPIIQIYLDNEMDALAANTVEAHVRECRECAALADRYLRLDALLAEAFARNAADVSGLRERVRSSLPARRQALAWPRLFAVAATGVAALGAVTLLVLFVSRAGDAPAPAEPGGPPLVTAPPPTPAEPSPRPGPADEAYPLAMAEHDRMGRAHTGARDESEMSKMVMGFTGGRPVGLSLAGLRIVAGHPCHIGEVPYAHLVYSLPDGRRVSVYLCREGEGGELPKGTDSVTSPEEGRVEIASIDGRTVAFSDARGVRRAVVLDGADAAEAVAVLAKIR